MHVLLVIIVKRFPHYDTSCSVFSSLSCNIQIVESDIIIKRVCSERLMGAWFPHFLEHQPHFSLRIGNSTAHIHMDALSMLKTLHQYFSLLHDTLKEHGLIDKPHQTYNVDESGIPFDSKTPMLLRNMLRSWIQDIWLERSSSRC